MSTSCPYPRPRGSVIAIVLAVIALAAFLLAAFVERSTTELLVETRAAQTARLRTAALSGLETALAVVASYQAEDGGLFSPAQGWGEPLAAADVRLPAGVRVRVLDETGRPSLPRMEPAAVARLLEELGLRRDQAERSAEALVVWTRQPAGSARLETEARQYEFASPPHRVPARPLGSLAELAAVAVLREHFFDEEGRPTELLHRFATEVSLHDFPAVNVNTATARAWELAGVPATDIARIETHLRPVVPRADAARRYFRRLAEAGTVVGSVPAGFDVRARILRVVVLAREGSTELRLEAVVAPTADPVAGEERSTVRGAEAEPGPSSPTIAYPFTLLAFEEAIVLDLPVS